MRYKKSQVTVFIIIGIILISVIAMLLYFRNSVQEDNIARSIETIRSLFRDQGKYNEYVTSCMDQATKEALILIGRQGGAIYDYQATGGKQYLGPSTGYDYGEYVLPYEIDGRVYNVSYGIKGPLLGSQYHPVVPFYPYGSTTLVNNPRIISPFYVNVFGNFPNNPMTPLCDFNGSNRRDLSSTVACETYDSRSPADTNSLQQYMERYIENKTMSCVRLDRLPELVDMSIELGNVTANLTFAEEHVLVYLVMPINIEVGNYEAEIYLNDFNVKKRVRLKKIHELVSHLINMDVNNIFFDIVRDAATITDCKDITGGNDRCLKPGMFISKIRNPCKGTGLCPEEYDDILVVEDREFRLDGVPYRFQFAIQNRAPALDLIREEVGAGSFYFDYVVFAGENIIINPYGIDPDEDQHNNLGQMDYTYHYYEWKETQDAYFDCPSGSCLINDPSHVVTFDSPLYMWTKSSLYNTTRRRASYQTTSGDIGFHVVKVEVCDEGDLCDYQSVTMLVVNGTFAGGINKYQDIPAGFASIEDPYFFVTPITFDLYPGETGLRYRWLLSFLGTDIWTADTIIENVSLPEVAYTITNIPPSMTGYFPSTGNYTLDVSIIRPDDSIVSSGSGNTVQVVECLPHRSFSPAYPYHTIDPFMANHSCCFGDPNDPLQVDWGTILPSSNLCYNAIEFGCVEDTGFRTYAEFTQDLCSDPDVTCLETQPSNETDGIANDIYRRSFSRNCDGTRGNTCTGDMQDTRIRVRECPECQECAYSDTVIPVCSYVPYGLSICNSGLRECTLGPDEAYTGMPGPWSCQGMCADGLCNTSVNCDCDTACGAVCLSNESYIWSDRQCIYNCNDFQSAVPATNCDYHADSGPVMTCSSPDPADINCFTDAVGNTVCPSDTSYFADIDSLPPLLTYCRDSGFCYYNVSCTNTGLTELVGDLCPNAGTVNGADCYFDTSGTTHCLFDGTCSNMSAWTGICDSGSLAGADCRIGEECFSPSCDTMAGWLNNTDVDIEFDSSTVLCSVIGCSNEFYETGGMCYYGISCTNIGWEYANNVTQPGSSCPGVQSWTCTDTGWECT